MGRSGPVIAEPGVSDLLASATGDEIPTRQGGHFGAFALPADEGELGHGAIETGKRTAAQIFADVRSRAPQALIDVHHPRLLHGAMGSGGGFSHAPLWRLGRQAGRILHD